MSNRDTSRDGQLSLLFQLLTQVAGFVIHRKRDPQPIIDFLQGVIWQKDRPNITYHCSPELTARFRQANPVQGRVLRPVYTLPRNMTQARVRLESGAQIGTVEDVLATIYDGQLRRDGWGEIFLLEDWAVRVGWRGAGLDVDAYPVSHSDVWCEGVRVFSY